MHPHPDTHLVAGATAQRSAIKSFALLCVLLSGLIANPAHALSATCLDAYIGTGAVPVGPDATWVELLVCNTTAMGFDSNMGNWYCRNHTDEYCGQDCSAFSDIQSCFEEPVPEPQEDQDKEKEDCDKEGNPCNPASGNKQQTKADYRSYDGRLAVVRHYHSLNPVDGPFGFGWSATGLARLAISADQIRVHQASGRSEPWQLVNGQWQGDPDSRLRLQAEGDGYRLDNPDLSVERFDAQGRLLSRTEADGLSRHYAYDANGRLASVSGPFGRSLGYQYDADNRIRAIQTPDGELRYAYDTQGNLTGVTYPDSQSRSYHYEDTAHPHHLTGITDERGVRLATWAYQADGRVILSEHAGGVRRVEFSYGGDTTQATGALGDSRSYRHSLLHGVRKITEITGDVCDTCGNGRLQRRSYDADGFLIGSWDWNGNETRLTRNARHLIESRTEAAGTALARTVTTEWHPDFERPVRIVEAARTIELSYDAATRRLLGRSLIDNASGARSTTAYAYNAQGLLASVDGPRTDVADITTYAYDAQGDLTGVTNALGQTTHITAHDPSGRPLTLIDPNGLRSELRYDPRGRLIGLSQSDGAATRHSAYAYDAAGNLIRVDAADGSVLHYTYDAANRLIGLEDGEGNRIDFSLDAMDNLLQTRLSDPDGVLRFSQQQVFNRLGRLIQSIDAQGQITGYAYDANGNLTETVDARQNPTRRVYDALDRLQQRTDALDGVTHYSYDSGDNLSGVTDPKHLTTGYVTDGLGNRLQQTSPDTGVTHYTYDAAGNRLSQTDARGVTVSYNYDALNRLTGIRYPDSGLDVDYSYDQGAQGIGRLSGMHDVQGQTDYRYNAFGELIEKTRTASDGTLAVTAYAYDSAGRLQAMRYPSGRRLAYGYDAQGRLERITLHETDGASQVLAQNIRRLPFGPIEAFDYGNGLHLSRGYDASYRLIEQSVPGVLQSRYQHDPVGNITQWQDLLDTGRDQQFGYDALDRLIGASGAYGELSYGYDAVGNRLSHGDGAQSETYSYAPDSHRLLQILGETSEERLYDEVGNTLQRQLGDYRYDDSNRLVGFDKPGLIWTEAAYAYNGQGQRVQKRVTRTGAAGAPITFEETVLRFVYDEQGRLIGEYDQSGAPVREYAYLEGSPLALMTGDGQAAAVYYLHTDHLGAVVRATDAAQGVVWDAERKPFGERSVSIGQIEMPLGFAGQYFDQETGNYYNYFRDYDPTTGRYLQSDPIGLAAGMNTYVYTQNNPLKFIDLLGLDIWIEGPSGSEPEGHQSINVGDPFGEYTSMSFGIDPSVCLGGCVYFDQEKGGNIESYLKTDAYQDVKAMFDLLNNMNKDSENWYGVNTCRTYSQDYFDKFKDTYGLTESSPPYRKPTSRSWFRRLLGPIFGPTSSSTSSSGSSTSR